MDICSYEHDEIVYDARYCPLCEAQEKIAELEKELDETRDQLSEAENNS